MPSKGNQYLIAAIPAVLAAEPETRFYVVGEGELQAELEAQARTLGVADRVTFVGFMRDVSVAYAAFDLVVFSSLWEGTPLTAFEALAMGRPIVATDCDGLLDILTPDGDARVVPRRDAGALAEAIIALQRDPEARERLGRHAKVTGAAYDIGQFVKRMEQLYELMHEVSRRTHRGGVAKADLGFLSRTSDRERAR
jgi:glycosyltransferase involved in cell wall biosynthesis